MHIYKILVFLLLFTTACSHQEVNSVVQTSACESDCVQNKVALEVLFVRDSELLLADSQLEEVLQSLEEALEKQTPYTLASYKQQVLPLSRVEPFQLRWSAWKRQPGDLQNYQIVLFIVPEDALKQADKGEAFLGYADATGVFFDRKTGMAAVVYSEDRFDLLCRMLHELGHLFGAGHDRSGVMHSTCQSPRYSQQSMREMQQHREHLKIHMVPFQSRRKEK